MITAAPAALHASMSAMRKEQLGRPRENGVGAGAADLHIRHALTPHLIEGLPVPSTERFQRHALARSRLGRLPASSKTSSTNVMAMMSTTTLPEPQ